jgi:hypothetical protein
MAGARYVKTPAKPTAAPSRNEVVSFDMIDLCGCEIRRGQCLAGLQPFSFCNRQTRLRIGVIDETGPNRNIRTIGLAGPYIHVSHLSDADKSVEAHNR